MSHDRTREILNTESDLNDGYEVDNKDARNQTSAVVYVWRYPMPNMTDQISLDQAYHPFTNIWIHWRRDCGCHCF